MCTITHVVGGFFIVESTEPSGVAHRKSHLRHIALVFREDGREPTRIEHTEHQEVMREWHRVAWEGKRARPYHAYVLQSAIDYAYGLEEIAQSTPRWKDNAQRLATSAQAERTVV